MKLEPKGQTVSLAEKKGKNEHKTFFVIVVEIRLSFF